MMKRRFLRVTVAVAAVAALATGGIAFAASGAPEQAAPAAAAAPSNPVTAAISAFRAPSDSSHTATQQKLKSAFASAAESGLQSGLAEFSSATPAPIAGASSQVWIAPSDGAVCTYIPDPVDGWGGTCATLSTVEAGEAFSILGGPNDDIGDTAIVAVVVADGGAAPTVVANGVTTALAVQNNVAAALVPTTDTLNVGRRSIPLSVMNGPTKVRRVG
jgi:hypothetical protein